MNTDNELISDQEARVYLRQSFLQAIIKLKGSYCKIITYERSNLEAVFSEWKPDGSEILVHDLKTPANIKMSSALLRTPDIVAIRFNHSIDG